MASVARIAAGVALALALVGSMGVERVAAASSGGRMGGSGGFSRSATRAYSYGGGHGTSSLARSGSSVAHHHHTTVISTGPSFGWGFGWGVPMWSPWGGVPVMVSPAYSALRAMVTVTLIAALAFVAIQLLRRGASSSAADEDDDVMEAAVPVTVAKVQVCVLAMARELKARLDTLGSSAATSSPEGLALMVQEAVLALLRHPEYIVSAHASASTTRDMQRAEGLFQGMSLEERARVRHETLSNSDGRGVQAAGRLAKDSTDVAELMVVTLMVAAEGAWEVPNIRTTADLRTALTRLGGVAPSTLLAAEITWTPQADNDSLTQQEVVTQYPSLVPL